MPTTAATLIQRTRRFVRDWPENDTLAASVTSGGTSLTIATGGASRYSTRWLVEIDQEALAIDAVADTTLTVRRAQRGTTAASHANASTILVRPEFLAVEYLDALNAALDACFPLLYKPFTDEYTGIVADTFEYDVPTMTELSVPIPYISRIEERATTSNPFVVKRNWNVVRGTTPFIKFRYAPVAGSTLRISGFGPFAQLTAVTDSLDSFFPKHAESLLPLYAAHWLLASGEAGRVRVDTGAIDNREQANRTGSSMSASNSLLARFERNLLKAAMPPMPKNVVPTL